LKRNRNFTNLSEKYTEGKAQNHHVTNSTYQRLSIEIKVMIEHSCRH